MRGRVGGTVKRRRRAAAARSTASALLTSCSTSIDGSPVKAAGGPRPGSVDIALLDVGNYPTRPSTPLGTAGTPEIGAIVEGQRMANYVTGPWEVDPSLVGSYADSAVVLKNAGALDFILPEALAAVGFRHNFVAGFYTARDATDGKMLRNAVLRFRDPPAAAAAATEFGAAAATEDVLTPPVTTCRWSKPL